MLSQTGTECAQQFTHKFDPVPSALSAVKTYRGL